MWLCDELLAIVVVRESVCPWSCSNGSNVAVYSLCAVALILCACFVFDPCYVLLLVVLFLVSRSPCWARESWLLYFICVLAVWVPFFFLALPLVDLQFVSVVFTSPSHEERDFFQLKKIQTKKSSETAEMFWIIICINSWKANGVLKNMVTKGHGKFTLLYTLINISPLKPLKQRPECTVT